jgi:hypothetical protein
MTSRAVDRIDAERQRRMRTAWQANEPSAFEVAIAERRIRARAQAADRKLRASTRYRKVLHFGALGAALGCTAMIALGLIDAPNGPSGIRAEPLVVVPMPRTEPPAPATGAVPEPPARSEPSTRSVERAPRATTAPRAAPATPAPEAPRAPAVERDQADLAQAELWLAVGRGHEAEPILTGLKQSGATEAIRKRAAELSERQTPKKP